MITKLQPAGRKDSSIDQYMLRVNQANSSLNTLPKPLIGKEDKTDGFNTIKVAVPQSSMTKDQSQRLIMPSIY